MDKRYLELREKMEKYNTWEAGEQKKISAEDRLKQFFILYDLGQMHDKNVLNQFHDKHLECLIETSKKLRASSKRSINTLNN